MNTLLSLSIKFYAHLLRLYPSRYRQEFEEQMLLDFSDMLTDAGKHGNYALIIFCLRELLEFPFNLLQAHWKEGGMIRILRSQPVGMGVRSALGFGLGFAVVVVAIWQISRWLFTTLDPWIQRWSVWYYDTFRSEQGIFLFQDFLTLFSTALTGLVFGLLFAFILGRRSNYIRYMLVGTLGFFISNSVSFALSGGFGWSLSLSTAQSYILGISIFIFAGAFWGAICSLLDNYHRTLLRFLVAGIILYPLSTYILIKLLLVFRLDNTPWFFMSLLAFILILISSVFVVVIRNHRKIPWMVIVAAVGYPVLYLGIFYFAYDILHMPRPEPGVGISPEALVVYQLNYMAVEASIGAIFGLLIGLIWGYQRKNDSRQVVT